MVLLTFLRRDLKSLADPVKAAAVQKYFKTGPGEYGEGDKFIGITVPALRKIAKKYRELPDVDVLRLLCSPIHEERSLALMIWCEQMPKAELKRRRIIAAHYEKHFEFVNNWDLVDGSAHYILGPTHEAAVLPKLRRWAKSKHLWTRRIAIITTFHFTRVHKKSAPVFEMADILIADEHDLIHKAVGWMLREAGKYCGTECLENFLASRYQTMPRTMLRYAIERFPEVRRKQYLKGLV